jgi:hypothetical protein
VILGSALQLRLILLAISSVLISFLSLNGVCVVKEPTSDGVEIKISGLRGLPD